MADTVCDHIVAILTDWGIDTVFGLPATGSTALSNPSGAPRTASALSVAAMKKQPHLPPAAMPS